MSFDLEARARALAERHRELALLLAEAGEREGNERYRELAGEFARLDPVVAALKKLETIQSALASAESLRDDPELGAIAREEIAQLRDALTRAESELLELLLPPDPLDARDVFLEIRAGTGGEEAALFAADLLRMYLRYAERRGWRCEILSMSESDLAGIREVVVRISGERVHSRLKFEAGTHRVQRVPVTESQGRIHTSAATVAVLPEADEAEGIELAASDMRIDTFRASGAGGQHVNKTDSAVRITHLPTGIVVECQDERSQHKNRAKALALLKARLLERERSRRSAEIARTRREQVGSGDRSERIRTYNFPQDRVTDHRIGLTIHDLDAVLDGDLDRLLEPLLAAERERRLAELARST
ncbi:MAG: peptide chain release factor 1 [Lysobacterales bacterium]|jgi:peptide chain release factor 1|nr:MAG: peptide chain release factor 1 [Xanthomonadales bacterium]